MPVRFHGGAFGISSIAWSQGRWAGSQYDACSSKTFAYRRNSSGMCSIDGFGAVRAAVSVECVILALISRGSGLYTW